MVSFKKQKKTSNLWHTDFADRTTLPDVKVIRTSFLVNFASFVVVSSLFSYLAFSEINAAGLRSQMSDLREGIEAKSKQNRQYIKLSKEFEKTAALVEDFQRFYKGLIRPHELLMEIAKNKPEGIVLDEAGFSHIEKKAKSKGGVPESYFMQRIGGTIQGEYENALAVVDSYVDALKSSEKLNPVIDEIEVSSLRRDPVLELFTYVIEIKLKPLK